MRKAELEKRRNEVVQEDMATIIYTSGTTGRPKGVMLSHMNIAQNALHSSQDARARPGTEYRVLSFLPVCHIFERMLHYLYMHEGAMIHFGESLETVKDDWELPNRTCLPLSRVCSKSSMTPSWPRAAKQAV